MYDAVNVDTDIVVVGAGPVGIFTVFAAGMLDMSCHVVDILDTPGGQCAALYPEKNIYDIPGIPVITGMDLVNSLMTQAGRFKPVYRMGSRVCGLMRNNEAGVITIYLTDNSQITCRAAIIASGNGAIRPRNLDVEDAEIFEGKSLFYSVNDVASFAGARVAIVGGGNSAVDWAIMLSDIASKISLIHRRDKFTCFPDSENKLRDLAKSGKIELHTKYKVARLEGDGGIMKRVHLSMTEEAGENKVIDSDNLLVFLGLSTDYTSISSWGINTAQFGRIMVDNVKMTTNISGVFAVGDAVDYPGKLKLIATGFSEACAACHAARQFVKNTPFHFEYSTTKLEGVA